MQTIISFPPFITKCKATLHCRTTTQAQPKWLGESNFTIEQLACQSNENVDSPLIAYQDHSCKSDNPAILPALSNDVPLRTRPVNRLHLQWKFYRYLEYLSLARGRSGHWSWTWKQILRRSYPFPIQPKELFPNARKGSGFPQMLGVP